MLEPNMCMYCKKPISNRADSVIWVDVSDDNKEYIVHTQCFINHKKNTKCDNCLDELDKDDSFRNMSPAEINEMWKVQMKALEYYYEHEDPIKFKRLRGKVKIRGEG